MESAISQRSTRNESPREQGGGWKRAIFAHLREGPVLPDSGAISASMGISAVSFQTVARAGLTLVMVCVLYAPGLPRAASEITFDASEFERRAFDFGGYAELWPEYLPSDQGAALYQLAFFGREQQDELSRTGAVLDLEGRYSRDIVTVYFRSHSSALWDFNGASEEQQLYEGVLALQPFADLSIDAGKKVNRWGKGIFWNPVGFIERPKDPNDPDLARQGFWMGSVDWIKSFDGPLQTVGFTPVVVPTVEGLNDDFGEPGFTNFAGKLYVLYRDTDLDLLFLTSGSRTARVGVDFSRNLAPNFEIHGEYAYISGYDRIVFGPAPGCQTFNVGGGAVSRYLLGLRYRTDQDIAYTFEYYVDGAGNSSEQQRRYYECVHQAWEEDDGELMARLRREQVSSRYARPNPMRQYLGLRAAWNEPFDFLYLTPALQAFYNLEDSSFQVAPELTYTGFGNFEFRLRGTVPIGSELTEWGEKANEYKIDLRMRYYF